jgi:cytochrome c553
MLRSSETRALNAAVAFALPVRAVTMLAAKISADDALLATPKDTSTSVAKRRRCAACHARATAGCNAPSPSTWRPA